MRREKTFKELRTTDVIELLESKKGIEILDGMDEELIFLFID